MWNWEKLQSWKRSKIVWLGIKVRLWSNFLDRNSGGFGRLQGQHL